MNSNVGTIVHTVPISLRSLKDTNWGRYLSNYQFMRLKPHIKVTGSAPIFAQGVLWVCYDPCGTLDKYPSRERALTLQGDYFLPGRHDSLTLLVDELATSSGFCNMDALYNGMFRVVLIKALEGFECSDYAMEVSLFFEVEHIGMELITTNSLPMDFLPLRHLIIDYELKSTLTKGKAIIIPINPTLPACDGGQFFPSCSSSILENHGYWSGDILLELVFNLPGACGGTVELAFAENAKDGSEGDAYRRFGSTLIDLRAHRVLRVKMPMCSYGGMCQAGGGSLLGTDGVSLFQNTLRLVVMFTSAPQFSDRTRSGSLLVRYLGIENPTMLEPMTGFTRMHSPINYTPVLPPFASGNEDPNLLHGVGEWQEPRGTVVPCGLSQKRFRLATFTDWSKDGFVIFPATPCCFFPRIVGDFRGALNTNNALAHRAQENARWRGKLKYYVSVRRKDGRPYNPAQMSCCVITQTPGFPCFVEKNTVGLLPWIDPSSVFDAGVKDCVLEVDTPPGRWYHTYWHTTENYTLRTCPRWILFQFPNRFAAWGQYKRHINLG